MPDGRVAPPGYGSGSRPLASDSHRSCRSEARLRSTRARRKWRLRGRPDSAPKDVASRYARRAPALDRRLIRIPVKDFDGSRYSRARAAFSLQPILPSGPRPLLSQVGRRGREPERMIEAHRDAPVSHRAIRVDSAHSRKGFSASSYQNEWRSADAALECHLCLGSAGHRKVYFPEICAGGLRNRSARLAKQAEAD